MLAVERNERGRKLRGASRRWGQGGEEESGGEQMQAQGAVEEVGAVSEQCSAEALTTGVPNAWLALRWLQSIQAPKPSVDADPSPGHAPFRLLPDILPQAYPCAPSPSSYSLTHACMHAQVRAGLLPLPPSRVGLRSARHLVRGVQGEVEADQ